MPEYGVGDTGFTRKPIDVINQEVEAALREISPQITLDSDEDFARAIKVLTGRVGELWDVLAAAEAGQDPGRASGAQLDAAAAMSGSRRRAATRSTVVASVTLDAGANIPAGAATASVASAPAARFVNAVAMVNGTGGEAVVAVEFVAEDTGPVAAPSGQLSVRETNNTGWTGITNDEDAELGQVVETDAEFRVRREQELQAVGGGTAEGIRGDFLQLEGVAGAIVLQNFTEATNSDGLPPHSIEVVLDADSAYSAEHAAYLFTRKPAGIRTHGSTSETITDSQGVERNISLSYVTEVEVYLAYTVTYDETLWLGGASETLLREAIVAASLNPTNAAYLGVGTDVYARRLACAALDVPGVLDLEVGVALSSISGSNPANGSLTLPITTRQRAVLDTGRIAGYDGSGPGDP